MSSPPGTLSAPAQDRLRIVVALFVAVLIASTFIAATCSQISTASSWNRMACSFRPVLHATVPR